MKYILSLIALLFISLGVNAQAENENLDTLNSGETVYYYPNDAATIALARDFKTGGNLLIMIQSDSLSGATDVVTVIQYANEDASLWFTQASGTLTSNGAASQTLIFEDAVFGASKWRIRSVANGTQATKISTSWRYKN